MALNLIPCPITIPSTPMSLKSVAVYLDQVDTFAYGARLHTGQMYANGLNAKYDCPQVRLPITSKTIVTAGTGVTPKFGESITFTLQPCVKGFAVAGTQPVTKTMFIGDYQANTENRGIHEALMGMKSGEKSVIVCDGVNASVKGIFDNVLHAEYTLLRN